MSQSLKNQVPFFSSKTLDRIFLFAIKYKMKEILQKIIGKEVLLPQDFYDGTIINWYHYLYSTMSACVYVLGLLSLTHRNTQSFLQFQFRTISIYNDLKSFFQRKEQNIFTICNDFENSNGYLWIYSNAHINNENYLWNYLE